ncbi:MAG: hypothetical protein Q4F49_05760 [Pseudoxanthomonas suwonensis]|nr:hypothetical protein [Pseudoxanthomonas suwonensis]
MFEVEISQRELRRLKRLMRNARLKNHAESEAIDYSENRRLDRVVVAAS